MECSGLLELMRNPQNHVLAKYRPLQLNGEWQRRALALHGACGHGDTTNSSDVGGHRVLVTEIH